MTTSLWTGTIDVDDTSLAVTDSRSAGRPVVYLNATPSYGAALAVRWADRHPHRVAGIVSVGGGVPWGFTGENGREEIERIWRRMRPFLPLVRPFGLSASMGAAQHAEVNIEINEISAALEPVLERLTCPVRYVLGSGSSLGGEADDMAEMRAALPPPV
jgi:pimeloyl-ACP methyl ester carboxylesterase